MHGRNYSNFYCDQELETHLTHLKLTHQLLSKYLPIDPWESIFSEVNESVSLVSFHGRIVLHVR